MKKIYSLILGIALVTTTGTVFAQFEGVIRFDKIKRETTKYAYFVKGDLIRVEETGSDGNIKGIMLVDLAKESVTALSPERKLYMDATNKRAATPVNPEIKKTSNKKEIQGYACEEWTAKSAADGTNISYWVTKNNDFAFFSKMLKVLNRKDKLSKYFLAIPKVDGYFTLIGTEKSADGKVKTELKVTDIEKKTVSEVKFEIPKGFQKFEK